MQRMLQRYAHSIRNSPSLHLSCLLVAGMRCMQDTCIMPDSVCLKDTIACAWMCLMVDLTTAGDLDYVSCSAAYSLQILAVLTGYLRPGLMCGHMTCGPTCARHEADPSHHLHPRGTQGLATDAQPMESSAAIQQPAPVQSVLAPPAILLGFGAVG